MGLILAQRLILILAGVALITSAGKRRWLSPIETALVGSAMIFAAGAWLLQAILNETRGDIPNHKQAVLIGIGLTAAIVLSLIVGLVILFRMLKSMPPANKDAITKSK